MVVARVASTEVECGGGERAVGRGCSYVGHPRRRATGACVEGMVLWERVVAHIWGVEMRASSPPTSMAPIKNPHLPL